MNKNNSEKFDFVCEEEYRPPGKVKLLKDEDLFVFTAESDNKNSSSKIVLKD